MIVTAAEITMSHLQDFIVELFSGTFEVVVETFDFTILDFGSVPAAIAYAVELTFSETSAFIPSVNDVDDLVELAFMEPSVLDLLADFQEQPPEMPFQETKSVEFVLLSEIRAVERVGPLSPMRIGLISGASVAFFLVLCYCWRQQRSRRRRKTLNVSGSWPSKSEGMPVIMPSHSFVESLTSGRANLMHFREDTESTTSGSVYDGLSTISIPSETQKVFTRPVDRATSSAPESVDHLNGHVHTSETQKLHAQPCESTKPLWSADLDIHPV